MNSNFYFFFSILLLGRKWRSARQKISIGYKEGLQAVSEHPSLPPLEAEGFVQLASAGFQWPIFNQRLGVFAYQKNAIFIYNH